MSKNKNTLFLIFFTIAFLERIVFDLGPNTELITASMLLAAAYLGRNESLWLTLSVLVMTDLILGNTNIFIFTWTGFLLPAFVAGTLFKKFEYKGLNKIILATGSGIGGTLFFFLWTNFGVWYLSSMYTKNLGGLIASYINGLPFLRLHLISTMIFVPVFFASAEIALYLLKRLNIKEKVELIFE